MLLDDVGEPCGQFSPLKITETTVYFNKRERLGGMKLTRILRWRFQLKNVDNGRKDPFDTSKG